LLVVIYTYDARTYEYQSYMFCLPVSVAQWGCNL